MGLSGHGRTWGAAGAGGGGGVGGGFSAHGRRATARSPFATPAGGVPLGRVVPPVAPAAPPHPRGRASCREPPAWLRAALGSSTQEMM